MKAFAFSCLVPALAAGFVLSTPAAAFARDRHHHYSSRSLDCGRSSGRTIVISGSPYYSRGYYSPYFYGSSSYPRTHISAGYSSGYCAPSTAIGFSLFSSPRYSYRPPTYYPSNYYRSTATSYSADLAVDVQRALRRSGYYYGDIDGDIGPESRAAIREFQRDRGLPATGRIDSSLLRALRIS